jgi:hypothetical protein
MSLSTSLLAYQDIIEAFQKALEDPKGIRLPFDYKSDAERWRTRAHMARKLDRSDNKQLHKPGDPLYAKSAYDILMISIKEGDDGTWFAYLEPYNKFTPLAEAESLSDLED